VDPSDGFYVPMSRAELIAMLRARQNEEIIRQSAQDAGSDWSTPELIAERLKDPQLAAAVGALQIRIDEGAWRATGEANPESDELVAADLADARLARDRLLRELARLDRHIQESLAGVDGDAERSERDFWPNQVDLLGGRIKVFDASGDEIATLEITGPNLERWLIDADVAPVGGGGE
jgi:hypothetical protein